MNWGTRKQLQNKQKKIQVELGRHYNGKCKCTSTARCNSFIQIHAFNLEKVCNKLKEGRQRKYEIVDMLKDKPLIIIARRMSDGVYFRLPKKYSDLIPIGARVEIIPRTSTVFTLKVLG